MAIKETHVDVLLGLQTDKHYESLGYNIPKRPNGHGKMCVVKGTKLRVRIEDVPHRSNVRVTKICDRCTQPVPNQRYNNVITKRIGDMDYCRRCTTVNINTAKRRLRPLDARITSTHPDISSEWVVCIDRPELSPMHVTAGSGFKVRWRCSNDGCNKVWIATIYNRAGYGTGCPFCNESKGERYIRNYLMTNNIRHIQQASYTGLVGVGGRPLLFDFIVTNEEDNWMLAIEYDGEQHSRNCGELFGGEEGLRRVQEHDRRKNLWCLDSMVKILRINYDVPLEQIPAMIDAAIEEVSINERIRAADK